MKKKLLTLVTSLTLIFTLFLTGCGVSQKMADDINSKAVRSEGYTYEQLIKDYGEPLLNYVAQGNLGGWELQATGLVGFVKGCKTKEELDAKYEKGETVYTVYVTVAFGKVKKATYEEYSPDKKD